MKHSYKRLPAALLALVLVLSMLPGLPMKAKAGGVFVDGLLSVKAGQEATIETQGTTSYQTTNMIFQCVGNTIATIVGYNYNDEKIMEVEVCDDDWWQISYNALGGYHYEVKVLYGQIDVSYNSANQGFEGGDPIASVYEFGDKLEWLVKPTINEVYLTVGDTAVLNVSEVNEGFSARASQYEDNYSDVARVSEDGTITARSPGTTTVYMEVLFWKTSTQYFYFWVPCTVHVVEDYTLGAYRDFYYAEPGQAYFNIVAYRPDGMRDVGFDVTVGDQTYNTGNRTNVLVDMPEDFDGSVTISKEGYVPYELKNEHLEVNNVITMTRAQGEDPVIQAVWLRKEGTDQFINAKYQTIQVIEDKAAQYEISYDAFWNGHSCSNVYLQQGNVTIPLSEQGDTVPLGQFFTADGGQIMLHALTTDGYVVSMPLLINMAAEVTIMTMDFGQSVSTTVDQSVNGLGGQKVSYDLLSTVPVKFAIAPDGSVRGIIGLKFGTSGDDRSIYDYYDEINQGIKQMEEAERRGDKEAADALARNLQDTITDRDAFLNPQSVNFGFAADASFLGYFDGAMTADGFDITEVGMIGIFSVSGTGYQNFYISGFPAQWRLAFEDELELLICGLADGSGGQLSLKVPEFTNTISATGSLSVGAPGTADVTATLRGSFVFDYPQEADSFAEGTWSMNASFNIAANLLCVNLDLLDWDSISGLRIWPESTQDGNSLKGTLMPAAVGTAPEGSIQDDEEHAYEETLAFRSDISADSVPQLVQLADMDVLVWTEAMSGRAEEDKPCLYYATRSHETDTWSEAAPVYDTGTRDASPRLMTVGDELYVVWQKSFGSLESVTEPGDILSSMDIYAARFDAASGTFLPGEMVHDPDDQMDLLPQIQQRNGEVEVVWVRVGGDPLDPDSEASIIRSAYSGEDGWVARPVADVPGVPDSLAAGEDGSVYYTLNGGLYAVTDGVTTAVTSGDVYARAVKFSGGTLYWLEDECVTDGTVRIPASGTAGDFILHTSPDGSRKALVFYASDANGRQLFATYGQGDIWGEPVIVMDGSDAWHNGFTGYYGNSGELCVAVNRLRTHASGKQVAYLRLVTGAPRQDLSLTGVDYLGTSMTEGGSLLSSVYVSNSGNLSVETAKIQVMQGEEILLTKAVYLGLMPGQSCSADLVIPMDIAVREGITVTVIPVNQADDDLSDNSAELVVKLGDISAEYLMLDTLPDGTVNLSAMLINRGMVPLEGIEVVFTRGTPDGEVLGTLDAGDAAVGQVIPVNVDLTGLVQGELVYMTARLDGEENYIANNTAFARVCPALRETTVIQSGDDFRGQQLEPDRDYSFSTRYDDQTGDAEEFIGTFAPEETGFYLVRLTGSDLDYSYSHFIFCEVNKVDGEYVDRKWVRNESTNDPDNGWNAERILSVYLEAGEAYSVNVTGSQDTIVTVRLEKAPAVTEIRTQDQTMYLGEHLRWDHSHVDDFGLVTFQPELSRDILSFTSSDEAVATVDEYGSITTNGLGTARITVTGQVYGIEESFTITVTEPEYGQPLILGENIVEIGEEEEQVVRLFTVPETGYYRFEMAEETGFQIKLRDEWQYLYEPRARLLRKGEVYPCYFEWSDVLTISEVEIQGDAHLGDDFSCEDGDCEKVMLYRFVPEEDHLLYIQFQGTESLLNIYDQSFNLLYSEAAKGSYWYSGGNLTAEMEQGKTYYIALEHPEEAYMSLSQVTMELNYYGAVFAGDTVELAPGFPNGGDEDDYTYTWASSDPSVARVEQDGTVQFLKEGDVTITVTAMDGLLKAEKRFYAIGSDEIYLNQEYKTTLDNRRIIAARLIFTPEAEDDYVYSIRYKNPGDGYWMYEYVFTDEDGNYLEALHSEYIQGVGNNSCIHLEADQTCVLTVYYEADSGEEPLPIDMSFLVSVLDCDTNGHTYVPGNGWEPGCDYSGMTDGEHCQVCGHVRVPQEEIAPLGHDFVDGVCTRCGENESGEIVEQKAIVRLAGEHRWNTAIKVADEMKANLGVEKFDAIIIASGNDFADALAGSYLSTVKNAPILLAWGQGGAFEYLDTDNIDYIKANLAEDGVVYILGGEKAVPALYETELAEYEVKRLGGADRFETNILILEAAGVDPGDEILVCTSTNFADSLSASATGKPILLVFNEYGNLYGTQPGYLSGLEGCSFTVIGGESAVSQKLADAVGQYGTVTRLAGASRFETSVMVAQKYFDAPESAVLAYAWNYPDGLCGGSLAYSMNAPLILTMTGYETKAAEYAADEGIEEGIVLGGTGLISDAAVRTVFAMDEADEIILK